MRIQKRLQDQPDRTDDSGVFDNQVKVHLLKQATSQRTFQCYSYRFLRFSYSLSLEKIKIKKITAMTTNKAQPIASECGSISRKAATRCSIIERLDAMFA